MPLFIPCYKSHDDDRPIESSMTRKSFDSIGTKRTQQQTCSTYWSAVRVKSLPAILKVTGGMSGMSSHSTSA